MAKINKQKISRAAAYLQMILAAVAAAILIYTAVALGVADSPDKGFIRDSVWRMVCCGCISVIFPYLAITQLRNDRRSSRRAQEK